MALSKLIIIWACDNIISAYLMKTLSARDDWKVIQIFDVDELDAAFDFAHEPEPEIVLISQVNLELHTEQATDFFRRYSKVKVLSLNFDNNAMEIYSKHQVDVKQTADLIAAIENSTAPSDEQPGDQSPANGL